MKDMFQPIDLDATDDPHSPPPDSNAGDRKPAASEFCEFGELFSGPPPPLDIELTVLTNNEGYAAKVFGLDKDGQLTKRSAVAIYEGQADRVAIANLAELRDLIPRLQPTQALCFGVPKLKRARLLTQETLRSGSYPDALARDRDHFSFRQALPGILMLDCDPRPGHAPRGWQEIDEIIAEIIPAWSQTQRLWRASSSAFLYRRDKTELIGMGGWRCYVVVDDASAIPGVGAYIYQRLWETGHGYILISKSGYPLDRSLIDASVWQPERVDFAAEPVLEGDLIRRAPDPELLPGAALLATAGLTAELTVSEWRHSSEMPRKAKEDAKPECLKVRKVYVAERLEILKRERPKTSEKRLQTLLDRAAERHILSSDFVLYRPDGASITVGELLADPEKWHQARFADPLEPEYGDDNRIAYANVDTKAGDDPYIWSHAHGGQRYRLVRESADLTLQTGERPRVLDGALAVLRGRGELFERGGEMVRVAVDSIKVVNDPWLSDYLGRHIRFSTVTHRNEIAVPADPPPWLCQQINAKTGERGLRELDSIITAPTLRPDGSLLCTPGYDEATGLLLRGGSWPRIPECPAPEQLTAAFTVLWTPFAEFPFVSKEDKGVMLACVLTGIMRRSLPKAPAFSFDAPASGSGKTLLAQCSMRICGGPPTVTPACEQEDEMRKRLLAALREGKPAILLDNIRGQFGSAALEAFLTSELYSDRVLGVSQIQMLPTNVLLMISGNNFHPKGDLYRRILQTRIDPESDSPERRSFDLEPLEYCREHRQKLVAAGLTLLRGFVSAGRPRLTKDRLASFERWDDIIRQCVLWIAEKGIADLGDPTACIEAAKQKEPERQKLAAFLEAAASVMKDKWRIADLIRQAGSLLDGAAALQDALDEIAGERGNINPRILGRWIERQDGARIAGFYLERCGTRQRAVLWRIRRYGQHQTSEPRGPESNSPNSQNSLSMSAEAQLATLMTPVANDEPVAVRLRLAN